VIDEPAVSDATVQPAAKSKPAIEPTQKIKGVALPEKLEKAGP
jgi:hypothetical protein